MPTTTEIAVIPVIAGTSIGDPNDHGAAVMKETSSTLHQQDGLQEVHFGTQVETPDNLQMLINWDSLQHHESFMASPAYQPFLARISTIMSGPASIHHVDFHSSAALTKALSAPVTELATWHCSGEPDANWLSNAAKAAEWLEKDATASGYLGMAYGITHEEVEYQGVKGKSGVAAIGWTSKEAHVAFRETQSFKENIGLLRGKAEAIEMHHVVLMQALD